MYVKDSLDIPFHFVDLLPLPRFENLKKRPCEQKKCPSCGSRITKRNGTMNGKQLYMCMACGRQFRSGRTMTDKELWTLYQSNKQTVGEIAVMAGKSPSTIKRRLRGIDIRWEQPCLEGTSGFVHLDVTYWGRNRGVLLALDDATCHPLYVAFVKHGTIADYVKAVETITGMGYAIRGIVIDGMRGLFNAFPQYRVAPQQSPAILQLHGKDSDMQQTSDIRLQIFSLQNDPLNYNSFISACILTYTPLFCLFRIINPFLVS